MKEEEEGRGEVGLSVRAAAAGLQLVTCQSLLLNLLLFGSPRFLLRLLSEGCNTFLTTEIF